MIARIILTITNIQGKLGKRSTCAAVITRLINASGNKNFQEKAISWSILTRGTVVLTQTIKKKTIPILINSQSGGGSKGPFHPAKKTVDMIADKAKASAYSTR